MDKCDLCGDVILPKDFDRGATKEKIPSYFDDDLYDTICILCNRKNK